VKPKKTRGGSRRSGFHGPRRWREPIKRYDIAVVDLS
jgi:hypothetical protein